VDIGQVTNFYKKINVAEIKLWSDLEVNDTIIIQGNKTGSITEKVTSMQVNGVNVDKVSKEDVGIKINGIVRENDHVYKKVQIKDV
jgi:putative protease